VILRKRKSCSFPLKKIGVEVGNKKERLEVGLYTGLMMELIIDFFPSRTYLEKKGVLAF
jgi:hypothetical protein